MVQGMEKLARHSEHVAIMAEVDARLELVVLYAVGDASGPCAGEVKIGVSTRSAFAGEMKTMRKYRSVEIVPRFEVIISGKGKGELLKTALLATLGDRGLAHQSWRRATVAELHAIVGKLAETYRVRLLSKDQAIELEHEAYAAIARERFGGC